MSDQNPFAKILALSNDDPKKILAVAVALCLVCSILVSAAAIGLRSMQEANKQLEKQRNILQVAGLFDPDASIDQVFEQRIEPRVVELATGAKRVLSSGSRAATFAS